MGIKYKKKLTALLQRRLTVPTKLTISQTTSFLTTQWTCSLSVIYTLTATIKKYCQLNFAYMVKSNENHQTFMKWTQAMTHMHM